MNLHRRVQVQEDISNPKYINVYCVTKEGRSVTPAGNKLLHGLISKKPLKKELKINSGAMLNDRKYLASQLKLPDDIVAISYTDDADGVSKVSIIMDTADVASVRESLKCEEGTSWEIIRKKV